VCETSTFHPERPLSSLSVLMPVPYRFVNNPLRVGLVGTGYAAKLRAETLQADNRVILSAIAGHMPDKTQEFAHTYGATAVSSWTDLMAISPIDLVIIATVNRDHGAIARAALEAGKHVIVEYPLSLNVADAEELIALATANNRLLHVEHIELLGGLHQALKTNLASIGTAFYARYTTMNPQHPAPRKWTYHADLFGFPLMGALSRLHRLTDLFGAVATVNCQARFWHPSDTEVPSPYYVACLCTAQICFQTGLLAEVTYGKGETIWRSQRLLEVHAEQGALLFDGDEGTVIQADGTHSLAVGSRRGLFAKDTAMVLDHLYTGTPLYVTPQASLYTLKLADAAQRSAMTGKPVDVG